MITFRRAAASLAATIALIFGFVAPASAAPPVQPAVMQAAPDAVPNLATLPGAAGYVNVWNGCPVGYCDAAWAIPVRSVATCWNVPSGSNDKITAVSNRTSHTIVFHPNAGCQGTAYTFYAGTASGDVPGSNTYSSYEYTT
jgi:hypothetical protein